MYYFNRTLERPLDPEAEGCPFAKWATAHREYPVAIHEEGFYVFLTPAELKRFDEYREADPYGVEAGRLGGFQRERFEGTLDLAGQALASLKEAAVLDIGCGEGHIGKALIDANPGLLFFGMDASLHAVAKARKMLPSAELAVADAASPPYAPESFDLVICNNLIEHVDAPGLLLERIATLLRPGGSLVLSTPNRYRIGNLVRLLMGRPCTLMASSHLTEYGQGQLKEMLGKKGLSPERLTSRPNRRKPVRWRGHLMLGVLLPVSKLLLRLLGRDTLLETTMFVLARKPEACRGAGLACDGRQ